MTLLRRRTAPHSLLSIALVCGISLSLLHCKKEADRWAKGAAKALEKQEGLGLYDPALGGDPIDGRPEIKAGAALNSFVPKEGAEGTKRIAVAEKEGFTHWKYQKDGKDLLMVYIVDTNNVPDSKTKYATATEKYETYPMTTLGKKQTSILVGDRYQVKLESEALDHEARKAWFKQCDLAGLAKFTVSK